MSDSSYVSASGGTTITLTDQNGNQEIREGGTRAWRCNNPAALMASPGHLPHGAIGLADKFDDTQMAIFPDRETGEKAFRSMLSHKSKETLDEFMKPYAPSDRMHINHPEIYQAIARQKLGVPGDTLIGNLTPEQKETLLKTIEGVEKERTGTITHKPAQQANSIDNNESVPSNPPNGEPSAQQNSQQPGSSTGDPGLDQLAAGLSSGNESAISQASTQIAQSPQVQTTEQQGRDDLAAQQTQQQATQQSQSPSLPS